MLQMYSKLTAVPGCHDSSEWLKWHALMLSRFNMTSHSQLTIANSGSSFLPPLDDGSSKWLQRCSWRAVPGRYGGSEWLKWHAFTLSGFNMTSHSQLTIANFCSSFFPPLDDGSSKWLQRCSWRAVPGRYGGSEWFKWYTLTLSCLDMTFHSKLKIANSGASSVLPIYMNPSNVFQDAVDELFQGAMTALYGWNDMSWRCLALIWHLILS